MDIIIIASHNIHHFQYPNWSNKLEPLLGINSHLFLGFVLPQAAPLRENPRAVSRFSVELDTFPTPRKISFL
jgi:hypothetical protein